MTTESNKMVSRTYMATRPEMPGNPLNFKGRGIRLVADSYFTASFFSRRCMWSVQGDQEVIAG